MNKIQTANFHNFLPSQPQVIVIWVSLWGFGFGGLQRPKNLQSWNQIEDGRNIIDSQI